MAPSVMAHDRGLEAANQPPTITIPAGVFDCWYDILIVEQCVRFTSDWTGPRSLKKKENFFFFRCSSGFFYDRLDESLKFVEEFWRLATAGKVHHCSKCLLFLNSWFAGVQTLRKCLCYTFGLIDFSDCVSLLFLFFFSSQHHVLPFETF